MNRDRSRLRRGLLVGGVVLVAGTWLGPLPQLAARAFTAYMIMHMVMVAVAPPLLAAGIARGRFDPVRRVPWLFAPLQLSLLEMVVVWAWHAPRLHHAARSSAGIMALEQASFLATGLLLWLAAYGGGAARRRRSCGPAIIGLLLTSMHMTLLGALIGLAGRELYPGIAAPLWGLSALEDQQLGGAIMLLVGGATYLAGGLVLLADLLRDRRAAAGPGVRRWLDGARDDVGATRAGWVPAGERRGEKR